MAAVLTNPLEQKIDRFAAAKEGARRFHAEDIGADVNPEHCFADWISRVRANDRAGIEKHYKSSVAKAAMAETSGTAGGYTVPVELSNNLIRDLSTRSLFRRMGAYVQPMNSSTFELAVPDVTTAQAAGTAPWSGGLLMSWAPDNNLISQTAPQFRNIVLRAWELSGYVYASNPMIQDSLGLEAWLNRLFAWSAAWYQDYAFFQGNGVGKPMGIINSKGSITVSRATGSQIKSADVQTMISNMLPSAYEDGLAWFVHPSALPQFNNTQFPGWVANYDLQMYGIPMTVTGKCSTLGSTGDLIFASPSLYIIGDRQQFEVAYSREEPTAFLNNQSAFRLLSRVDGQPFTSQAITEADGTSLVSPFVILK